MAQQLPMTCVALKSCGFHFLSSTQVVLDFF